MKYLLPVLLLASAAWAAQREPGSAESTRTAPRPPPGLQQHVPWLDDGSEVAEGEGEPYAATYAAGDPHAGLYAEGDPHAGLYDGADPGDGMCPRDDFDADLAAAEEEASDPHAATRAATPGIVLPRAGVARSTASNGKTISELHAQRTALEGELVRVRGVVVKRTDGILGETYLHLRDGSGSPTQQDDDLTVTTTREFELGETLELEGRLRVDQDIGLGYQYPVLLAGATRSGS